MLMGAVASSAQSADPVATARALARAGKWSEALQILERRIATQPNDSDALVLRATILSWQHRYAQARQDLSALHLTQPWNSDATTALANLDLWSGDPDSAERLAREGLEISSDNVDLMVIRASALRRLNRRVEALRQIDRASALSPGREDVRTLHRLLHFEVHGSEVTATANYEGWDDGREPLHESQIAYQHNRPAGVATARLTQGRGFGRRGTLAEVEFYPRIGRSYGYLNAGTSVNGDLYGSRFGAEFFQVIPSGTEASVGFRRLNFATPVNLWTASVSVYLRQFLFMGRGNHVARGASGNSVSIEGRRYFPDEIQYVGIRIGGGSVRDQIDNPADVEALSTRDVMVEGFFLIEERWTVSVRAGTGNRVRRQATVGLGYRF